MFILFLVLIIYLLFNIKYHKNIDKDYLNKNNTVIVNALFVIIVFYSHFSQYIGSDFMIFDKYFFTIVHKIGQLMVTTFLFLKILFIDPILSSFLLIWNFHNCVYFIIYCKIAYFTSNSTSFN